MTSAECCALEPYFSQEEIKSTGAKIEDIQPELFKKLLVFRKDIDRSIRLLHGGITTGSHKSAEHPEGRACDFCLEAADGPVDAYYIYKRLIDAGFNRIGVYFNGTTWSFHAAYGPRSGFWSGRKKARGTPWVYDKLRFDLPELLK